MLFRIPLFLFVCLLGFSQGTIKFFFKDNNNKEVPGVKILVIETKEEFVADSNGFAKIVIPAGKYHFQFINEKYNPQTKLLEVQNYHTRLVFVTLSAEDVSIEEQVITDKIDYTKTQEIPFMQVLPIKTKELVFIPAIKSDIEAKLFLMPGVSTSSEFSSQYRVRGGNYDENLIYINGVQIFRPQLVRSGQQEGLGVTNAFLVGNALFSTGGFPAIYGDKMSSVLDVKYRVPSRPRANIELGLITLNANVENAIKKSDSSGVFTYQVGVRRFSMRYFLNSLQTKGSYKPSFWDVQTVFNYFPKNNKLKFMFLFMGTRNNYYFEPQSQETTFGTLTRAFRLFVAYEGREISRYTTSQSAVKISYKPSYRFSVDLISSYYVDLEEELVDVEGGYRLGDVNTNFGNEDYNEVIFVRGIGTQLTHRRNILFASVFNNRLQTKWVSRNLKHIINSGIIFRNENIWDKFKEWFAEDSSDYIRVYNYVNAQNQMNTNRYIAYAQHNYKISQELKLQYGLRYHFWDFNNTYFITPRLQFIYDPSKSDSSKQFQLRFATGGYFQPAFYRELRDFSGIVHKNVPMQKSWHFIFGGDYLFYMWERPFKFFGEVYYKRLLDLIPFELQNVRVRYYPETTAEGYAYGADFRLSGQFIHGLDSWLSLSLLKTKERLKNHSNYIYRPTDQRIIFSLFFQDYVPNNPTIKFYLTMIYNSGLPFGPPRVIENRTVFRSPAYQRVDVGVSKLISFQDKYIGKSNWRIESIWLSLEIYNLFGRYNTIGYQWIKDVYNNRFAVPNYLAARLLNLRVVVNM